MPRKSKAEPWEGDSSDDNNWDPEENLDSDLLSTLDDSRPKKDTETTHKSEVVDESGAPRKRGRGRDKKKKIEEIEKPRGVHRGLQPEKILAAQLHNSSVFFLVKWQNCLELDVVPGKDLNQHFPEFVIQYYESCVPFSVRHKTGRIPRIAPELPPPPEVPEAPMDTAMDVSDNLEPPPMQSDLESTLQSCTADQPADTSLPPPVEMPDMSLPDLALPEVSSQPEDSQLPTNMEVPVN